MDSIVYYFSLVDVGLTGHHILLIYGGLYKVTEGACYLRWRVCRSAVFFESLVLHMQA